MWKLAAIGLVFCGCAGSRAEDSPPQAAVEVPRIQQPAPLVSLNQALGEEQRLEERSAKLKEETEPKAVRGIRDVLAPNAQDQRLGVPNYAMRFTRAIGSQPP